MKDNNSRSEFVRKFLMLLVVFAINISAEPQPGDVFKEHIHAVTPIRVGGSLDYGGRDLAFPGAVDLSLSTKAEINLQKLLCHDRTKGLRISVNGNEWIPVPEAPGIPVPQWEYQHMNYPTVEVPLSHLVSGENAFALQVDETGHAWNWPQNIIYGVLLRVYYSAAKPHPSGSIRSPASGASVGNDISFSVDLGSKGPGVSRVDYLGFYRDFDYEGNGESRQWHYHFFGGNLLHHIGTSRSKPFSKTWKTDWIADQDSTMRFSARIVDDSGMVYMTKAVEGVTLRRPTTSVELCEPYSVPKFWVGRYGEHVCSLNVENDLGLGKAKDARLIWSSWSPCYANGIYVNDRLVIRKPGISTCYSLTLHKENVPVSFLRHGSNAVKTGKMSQDEFGNAVHGMEVNWPGIALLVRYERPPGVAPVKVRPNSGRPLIHQREGVVLINSPTNGEGIVRIYSVGGREVLCRHFMDNENVVVRMRDFLPGLYLFHLDRTGYNPFRERIIWVR